MTHHTDETQSPDIDYELTDEVDYIYEINDHTVDLGAEEIEDDLTISANETDGASSAGCNVHITHE